MPIVIPPISAAHRPGRRRFFVGLKRAWALWGMLATVSLHGWAGQADLVEYQIKAAFLYKFGAYVEWPTQAFAQADSPLTIGVMGADMLAEELVQISTGRAINGHPVNVKKLRRSDALTGIHVLFIARSESSRLPEAALAAKAQPVLVVTENDPPPPPGSMINFVVAGDKVRFDIVLPSAESGSLKLSARLLTVARKVIGGPS